MVPEEVIAFGEEKPLPVGGARVTWTVTAEELAKGDAIEFASIIVGHNLVQESDRRIEDLDEGARAVELSEAYGQLVMPRVTG